MPLFLDVRYPALDAAGALPDEFDQALLVEIAEVLSAMGGACADGALGLGLLDSPLSVTAYKAAIAGADCDREWTRPDEKAINCDSLRRH